MKTLIRSINRSPLRCGFFTLAIALTWFALSPPLKAAACPDDCDNGLGKTALGFNALQNNTGINNTAVGDSALQSNTNGSYNVAIGGFALRSNLTGFQNMAIGAESLANNIGGTFNMGIGMIIICVPSDVSIIKAHVAARGTTCYEVGRVITGSREVKLI